MSVELLRAADTDVDPEGAELDYVARARELLPLIGEAAAGVEAGRRLDERVITALHEAGLFRMMMPRWLGGGEAPPSEFVQVIETIARADASTAWCLSQMMSARCPRSISTATRPRRCSAAGAPRSPGARRRTRRRCGCRAATG